MRPEFKKSIEEARKIVGRISDLAHGSVHIESVVRTALRISKEYPEVDSDLLAVAAWWHDAGRLYSKDHEKLGAEMAEKNLIDLGIEEETCKKVYNAIVFHKWFARPQTIEGEIVRDADKLDFISIPRWELCQKDKNLKVPQSIIDLLPKLRNEILHLDISREIFDERIIEFKKYIQNITDPDFLEIKKQVLDYFSA